MSAVYCVRRRHQWKRLPIPHSNSMNEMSCRESVPNKTRSNPACGGIGCVPVAMGSTVGVGVGSTEQHATDPPC